MRNARLLSLLLVAACGDPGDGGDASVGIDGSANLTDGASVAQSDGPAPVSDGDVPFDFASTDLGPRTISGKALSHDGTPMVGFKVAVGAMQTTTDAAGAFSLTVPAGSYDLLVAGTLPANTSYAYVTKYVGLTRNDPTVRFDDDGPDVTNRSVTLSGSVSGIALPLPAGASGIIRADPDAGHEVDFSSTSANLNFTSFTVAWNGVTPLATTVRALFTNGNTVLAYGKAAVTLASGTDMTLPAPIAVTTPTTKNLTVTFTAPVGVTGLAQNSAVSLGPTIAASISGGTFTSGTLLTMAVPDVPEASVTLFAHFLKAPRSSSFVRIVGAAADAALGTVAILPPPVAGTLVGAPMQVARDADFPMQAGAIGAVRLTVFAAASGLYTVVSTSTTVQFPDASPLGVANPATGALISNSIAEYPYAFTDEVAGPLLYTDAAQAVAPGKPFRYGTTWFDAFAFKN